MKRADRTQVYHVISNMKLSFNHKQSITCKKLLPSTLLRNQLLSKYNSAKSNPQFKTKHDSLTTHYIIEHYTKTDNLSRHQITQFKLIHSMKWREGGEKIDVKVAVF